MFHLDKNPDSLAGHYYLGEINDTQQAAWRKTLAVGIEYMRSKY